MLAAPNGLAQARLGVIVGRNFDRRSTRRNRFKRCVRDVYRLRRHGLKGMDILVRAKSSTDQETIREQLNEAYDQLARSSAKAGANMRKSQAKRSNLAVRSLLGLIGLYRLIISPLLGGRCRFYPTCSHYAMQAVTEWGVVRGLFMVGKRFFKCHPFHPGGYDPVPTSLGPGG